MLCRLLSDSKVPGWNSCQGAELTVSGRVSGGASHGLEVPSILCNWFKAWYSHSLLIYISQQTSLSFLTYKHTKLRLALVQWGMSSVPALTDSKVSDSNPHRGAEPTVSCSLR